MAAESLLHKRLLGRGLAELRLAAGISLDEAAEHLSRAPVSVWRFEQGKTMIDGLQLRTLCDLYRADPETRKRLEDLHELASQPTWWSHLGPRPPATAGLLGMEDLARRIRGYDHSAIPGLLQTPAYAHANIKAVDPTISRERLELAVRLRMERQTQIWDRENPPEAVFLIDEAALHRQAGPPEARRAQLSRLRTLPPSAVVQIVPFSAGPHPSLGTYLIFDIEFESGVLMRGVYVEGSASGKGFVSESADDVQEYEAIFERTRAKALTPKESALHIQELMKGISDD